MSALPLVDRLKELSDELNRAVHETPIVYLTAILLVFEQLSTLTEY